MSNKERSRFASEASEDRELENKEFQTAVADQVATQQILEKVSALLRVSKIGKINKFLQIFGGLVLGCIKTKFCKKILKSMRLTAFF